MTKSQHEFFAQVAPDDCCVRESDDWLDLDHGVVAHRPSRCTFVVGLREGIPLDAFVRLIDFESRLAHCCHDDGEPETSELLRLSREAILMHLGFLGVITLKEERS